MNYQYKKNNRLVPNMEEILLVENDDKYPKIFINNGEALPLRQFLSMKIGEFIEKFPEYDFLVPQFDYESVKNNTFMDIVNVLKKQMWVCYFSTVDNIIKMF